MKNHGTTLLVAVIVSGLGCGVTHVPEPAEQVKEIAEAAGSNPEILERPFAAEQIRDEWTVGFQLRVRQWSPEGESFERWTVVFADEEVVDIGSVRESESGEPLGEPEIQRSTWVELRDHASFPASETARERASRETSLGTLDGWLYTVGAANSGNFSEFFFADSLPGAPAVYRTVQDGEVVRLFEQVERSRP